MRILFIPDTRGRGHEIRCGALADELERRGHQADFGAPREIDSMVEYQAVVIDLKGDISMASAVKYTIRIIDDPEGQKGAADLTVLGSAGKDPRVVGAYALIGPEYSLLRPQFRLDSIARTADTVLDARRMEGWSASYVAAQMSRAAVVITYGGMRAMEAACCGAPMVVVPRNRGEHLNARGLVDAGAAIMSSNDLAERNAELLLKTKMLDHMSRVGRELVDGRGCERVADEIERLCR